MSATVPATAGAAMLVPLSVRYGLNCVGRLPASRYCGFSTYILLFGLASDATPVPGATRSGLAA